ncbi:MAG: ATP-binding cassette domain-containing protein [Bradyrhizobium sp.]
MSMPTSASALELNAVTRRFPAPGAPGNLFTAVERLSFSVRDGEFVAIVGPSGCGKSTILNLVAGLDRPSDGIVSLGGEPVLGPSPHVGFMLQKDLLLPWRSIIHNVEVRPRGRNHECGGAARACHARVAALPPFRTG